MSKRSKNLHLAIMGAIPLVLAACGDDGSNQQQQMANTNAPVYKTVDDCVKAGNESSVCQQAFAGAQNQAPRFNSQNSCMDQSGANQCVMRTENGQSIWVPMLTGFMLGRMLNGGYTYHPVYHPVYYHPVYTYHPTYRSHSWGSSSHSYATTRTRGVFGSSASARGSWGGHSFGG